MLSFHSTLAILLSTLVACSIHSGDTEILFADFEAADYGDWKTTGTAFGERPAQGTLPGQMAVQGFRGKSLVNSFLGGDPATGSLTSPEFRIERAFITFLIGGGGHAGKTCINLLIDGKVVRTEAGPNTHSGGSEDLSPVVWNVSEFKGQSARLAIVDDATGGWGHINVDHIAFTDVKPRTTHAVELTQEFLHLPVRKGAPKRRMAILVDGAIVRELDIELSDQPEWYAHIDVSPWKGKTALLKATGIAPGDAALNLVVPAATLWNVDQLYKEPLRSQIHFSTRRGWLNDPNGMVYANGEYHLFCQHNPYGWDWGNMHWAHAVSRDLVHWEEVQMGLYPAKYGDWAFSGSAVVDKANTSGWKKGENDLLVAAYTSTGRGECIVYSNDKGRTWTEYDQNPVVKHVGRDPRLLWHEASRQWSMSVYQEAEGKQWIAFYTSSDLKTWTYQSRVDGYFECPDIFELPIDGDPSNRYWVLTAADSDYSIGTFTARRFLNTTPKIKGNFGRGFYAAQTFINDPKNRVIQVGWLQAPSPGMPFNQCMSVPQELSLKSTSTGVKLARWPIEELAALREKSHDFGGREVAPETNPLSALSGDVLEVEAVFDVKKETQIEFQIRGIRISYDGAKQELSVQQQRAHAPLANGKQHLRFFIDRTCVEVFASGGLTYIPLPVIPKAEDRSLSLTVRGNTTKFERLTVHELGSIYAKRK